MLFLIQLEIGASLLHSSLFNTYEISEEEESILMLPSTAKLLD